MGTLDVPKKNLGLIARKTGLIVQDFGGLCSTDASTIGSKYMA